MMVEGDARLVSQFRTRSYFSFYKFPFSGDDFLLKTSCSRFSVWKLSSVYFILSLTNMKERDKGSTIGRVDEDS